MAGPLKKDFFAAFLSCLKYFGSVAFLYVVLINLISATGRKK